jgi:transcription termination/antitermination protein NusG
MSGRRAVRRGVDRCPSRAECASVLSSLLDLRARRDCRVHEMGPTPRERRPNSLVVESVQWFALHVKRRYEQAVAASLQGKNIESLVPVWKERRRWSDRLKTVQSPIFPGYVFCRLKPRGRLAAVRTPGVIRLVGFGGQACPLEAAEVESLLALSAKQVTAQPCGYLPIGQRVRLVDGPLTGLTGVLARSDNANRLIVSIDILQRSIAVDVGDARVQTVAPLAAGARGR